MNNFKDTVNVICSRGVEIESREHYLLRCQNHTSERSKLLKGTYNLISSLLRNISNKKLENFLLYGSEDFELETDEKFSELTITFIKSSQRFAATLF